MQGWICWAATNQFVKGTRLTSACRLFIPVLRKVSDWVHSPLEAGRGKMWGGGGSCWVVYSWVEWRLPPSRGGLWLQGRVLLGLEFYQVYLPFLYLICFMTEPQTWFFLILAFLLGIYFKYSNFWHAKRILFLLQWNPREMLGFSFICSLTGDHFHKDTKHWFNWRDICNLDNYSPSGALEQTTSTASLCPHALLLVIRKVIKTKDQSHKLGTKSPKVV